VSLGPTAFGAVIDDRFVNTTTLTVRGIDLTGSYRFDLGDDQIALGGNATYTFDYDQQVTPTSAVLNKVGIASFPVRFRSRVTTDWTRGRVTAGVALNYIGAYRNALGVGINAEPTADLQVRLAPAETGLLRGLAISFNVRNVFDRDPPFYTNSVGVGYDPTNADPIGRFASVQLVRVW
jgi:iron complex outermembrane receptor protein